MGKQLGAFGRASSAIGVSVDTGCSDRSECSDGRASGALEKGRPTRAVLVDITGRWGSLILVALRGGTMRFNELHRRVDGVSEKMLSQGLRALERDGFVQRIAAPRMPLRVDYRLTSLGMEIAGKLYALVEFLDTQMQAIEDAQRQYDAI